MAQKKDADERNPDEVSGGHTLGGDYARDEHEGLVVLGKPLRGARAHAAQTREQHARELHSVDVRRRLRVQPRNEDDACARQLTSAPVTTGTAFGYSRKL